MTCRRCEQEREATAAPFPGELGKKIGESVCVECWTAWQAEQTKIINEYRLSLIDPKGRELLDSQMKAFLKLQD